VEPPLKAPSLHYKPSCVADLSPVFSERLTGALGFVITTAPEPSLDPEDEPLALVATTFAKMLSPTFKEKGEEVRVARGIVQDVVEMIVLSLPSQLLLSTEYTLSVYFNVIV